MKPILDALLTVAIFWTFVLVLLTAPVWGKWIDGETLAWERAEADLHAAVYESVRCQ